MIHPRIKTTSTTPIIDVLKMIEDNGYGVIFAVDENDKLLGVVTDGDIRRGLLKQIHLTAPVSEIMNKKFYSWPHSKDKEKGLLYLKKNKLRHLPIIDEKTILVDVLLLDEEERKQYTNPIVFMVGGMGKRLYPLTKEVPKPMLTIGGKPIMELMLEKFTKQGFGQYFVCTNYLAEYIENHFQNGEKWSVNIKCVREDKPLGTAGALTLLKDHIHQPFVVINGDVMSSIDLGKVVEYHNSNPAAATVCVARYGIEIPYGVVEVNNQLVTEITEKPTKYFQVNSGIYLFDPKAIAHIPNNEYFDMPSLIRSLLNAKEKINSFPVHEYWADIGNLQDYEKVNADFGSMNK